MRRFYFLLYMIVSSAFGVSCKAEDADPSRFVKQREAMVRIQIESRRITDMATLEALRKVERHKFVPLKYQNQAYEDHPLPIGEDQTIFDLKMEDFKKVSELNLNGSVLPSMVFGEVMAGQAFGSIVNISSMTATQAVTRVVGYSASKAAIDNFTKWMATEMALKFEGSVRVNAIAPGFFIGNQNRALLTNPDGTYTERGHTIIKNTPMKRFGDADELNGAIHWLISDAASFVTGTIVPIDGGFSAFSGV